MLVLRWNTGMTFGGRSQCFSCNTTLKWHDLLPVISYVMLRGRCRRCKTPISMQYPIIEAISALVAFSIVLVHGLTPAAILFVFAAWILVAASMYDIRHMILPDAWTLLVGLLGVIGQVAGVLPVVSSSVPFLDWGAGIIFALPFFVLWLISRGRMMGFGDIKLMLVIGLIHGWSLGLSSLLLAFWVGAVTSLLWLGWSKLCHSSDVSMRSPLPFGPFLAFGTIVSMIIPVSILSLF